MRLTEKNGEMQWKGWPWGEYDHHC